MDRYWRSVCFVVAFLVAPWTAGADDCPPPDLSQCLSEAYLGTSCGAIHREDCRVIAGDEFMRRLATEGQDPQRFFRADGAPERVGSLLADIYAPLALPAFGPTLYSELVPRAQSNPTASRHPEWENGTAMNSCKEYVYKKYYDYNRLEDAIKGYGDNYEGIYQMMLFGAGGPGGIASLNGRLLKNKEGAPLAPQPAVPPPPPAKNAFFTSWQIVLADFQSMPEYSFDPEFNSFVDALGRQFRASQPDPGWPDNQWWYHRFAHDGLALYELSPQGVAYVDNKNDRYKALVDDFVSQKLFGHGAGAGSGYCNPAQGPCDLNALRQAIIAMLTDELNREWLFSCLNLQGTLCDWTPRVLPKAYVGLYAQREQDLTRCVDITAATADFTGLVPSDKRINLATFETFLTQSAADQEQIRRQAPWRPEDPRPNSIGRTNGDHHSWGWDQIGLSAGYDYDYGWSIWVPTPRGVPICQLGQDWHATGGVWAHLPPPIGNIQILDTNTNTQLQPAGGGHFHSHTTIAGRIQLYQPIDISFTTSAEIDNGITFPFSWDMSYPILIFVVNVNFSSATRGGLAFTETYRPGVAGCNPETNVMDFNAAVRPYVKLDVSSAVGVSVLGLAEVGVEGQLNLLNLSLPFTASTRMASNNLSLTESAKLQVDALGGRVDIYARAGVCPFCQKGRKSVGSWEGIRWEATLSSKSYDFGLPSLQAVLR